MSENPLLLSSAKVPVIIEPFVPKGITLWLSSGWRVLLVAIWIGFALVGIVDLAMRAVSNLHVPNISSLTPLAEEMAVGPVFAILSNNNHLAVVTPTNPVTQLSTTTPDMPLQSGIIPARLTIPSIGVNAKVESVGVGADGAMQTPSSFGTVAWYKYGSQAGAAGNAVIDGHVNNALTSAGVFEHLDQIRLGDKIVVADAAGNTETFVVQSEQIYSVDKSPTAQIFARTGPSQLVLITCDGAWDQGKDEFNERLVVYAALSPQQ